MVSPIYLYQFELVELTKIAFNLGYLKILNMTDKITTPGAVVIKTMLPSRYRKKYDLYRVLDKGGVKDLISELIQDSGPDSFETINNLAHLFFNKATEHGFSTPLSDYENDSEDRQAMLKEFQTKVQQILATNKSKAEKYKELNELAGSVQKSYEQRNIKYLLGKGSTAAKMALTGARGNPTQLAQGTFSPLMSKDIKGNPIPVPIKKSFAEGLSPAEHLAMSYGGRSSTVMTQLSTSLPGALFKELTPNVFHEVVTIPDCHTRNGIIYPISDKDLVLGRYQSGTNKLVTEEYLKDLQVSGTKEIKVRTPLVCEAKEGICQKCYGLSANGRLPEIGENVGVIAAQSASEVLTQAVLSTKHSGGVAGKQRNAYEEANNLLRNPENFQDEATISTLTGKVTGMKETPLKDTNVYINGVEHFVPRSQDVLVKEGDHVLKGQSLSTGTVNPRQLVELNGLGAGRKSMSDQLRGIYNSYNSRLDPRHFDIIAKNLIRHVKINHPGDTGFMEGQVVSVNSIAPYLEKTGIEIPTKNAVGKVLAERVLELTPGTVLDQDQVDKLILSGVDKIKVSKKGDLQVTPLVPGLKTAKSLDPNWVSKLTSSRLRNIITEAAATGEESPIHSTDPITSYVMGSEFGEGTQGRY